MTNIDNEFYCILIGQDLLSLKWYSLVSDYSFLLFVFFHAYKFAVNFYKIVVDYY